MKEINSISNDKIKYLVKLKNNANFIKNENSFLIEGINMVQEAIFKNVVLNIFLTKKNISKIYGFEEAKIILINEIIAKKISSTKNDQGVFAVCKISDAKFEFDKNFLILDDVQDPGNMGTLIRSAASFNFKNVVASEKSVSFYNDKVLRSTQGNIFNVNHSSSNLQNFIKFLKEKDYLVIGTIIEQKSIKLKNFKIDKNKKIALILGNEGNGISDKLKSLIDVNLNIEMRENVESLNVSVAGSIIMYNLNLNF